MLSLLEVSPCAESCPALPNPPSPLSPSRERRTQSGRFLGSKHFPLLGLSPYSTLFRMAQGWEKGRSLLIPTLWLGYLNLGNPRVEARKGSHRVAERYCPSSPQAIRQPSCTSRPSALERREGREADGWRTAVFSLLCRKRPIAYGGRARGFSKCGALFRPRSSSARHFPQP